MGAAAYAVGDGAEQQPCLLQPNKAVIVLTGRPGTKMGGSLQGKGKHADLPEQCPLPVGLRKPGFFPGSRRVRLPLLFKFLHIAPFLPQCRQSWPARYLPGRMVYHAARV